MFPNHEISSQKWFVDLKSDLGNRLFFDYYIEDLLLCIEADGPSHSNPKHPWYSEKVVRRDTLKNEYCNTKGLTLVRIPWKGKITPEYIRSCFPGIPLETA